MSYDVITHEKLDAVVSELKAIRSVLEVLKAAQTQVVEISGDTQPLKVVRVRGKAKENE